jgi:hypothetical protein
VQAAAVTAPGSIPLPAVGLAVDKSGAEVGGTVLLPTASYTMMPPAVNVYGVIWCVVNLALDDEHFPSTTLNNYMCRRGSLPPPIPVLHLSPS